MQKITICAPSHNFVGQSEKKLKQQYCVLQYGELRPTSGWDRFVSLGHPSKFQRVLPLRSITARQSSSGCQPNFAVLNRGRMAITLGISPHSSYCLSCTEEFVQLMFMVKWACICVIFWYFQLLSSLLVDWAKTKSRTWFAMLRDTLKTTERRRWISYEARLCCQNTTSSSLNVLSVCFRS